MRETWERVRDERDERDMKRGERDMKRDERDMERVERDGRELREC